MAQRLRIVFRREGRISYLSHLELMRMWERAFRRAGWRLAFSHGFKPHPKISLAAALPVGVAAEAELMDVYLEQPVDSGAALLQLSRQMPAGVEVRELEEVPAEAPPVQRLLKAAEYLALLPPGLSREQLSREVDRVLGAESLPRQRARDGKPQSYDLRPMVHSLALQDADHGLLALRIELRTDAQGAGRPDELLRELGIDPADCRITRLRLLFYPS